MIFVLTLRNLYTCVKVLISSGVFLYIRLKEQKIVENRNHPFSFRSPLQPCGWSDPAVSPIPSEEMAARNGREFLSADNTIISQSFWEVLWEIDMIGTPYEELDAASPVLRNPGSITVFKRSCISTVHRHRIVTHLASVCVLLPVSCCVSSSFPQYPDL